MVESYILNALKYYHRSLYDYKEEKESEESDILIDVTEDKFFLPKIVVVGIGGAGNNIVHRLSQIGAQDMVTIAINTDLRHLKMVRAHKKILISKSLTKGLGASGHPEIGRKAAEYAKYKFEELLKDANMVFVCVGMGGGTGTGAAPVVAQVAKKTDAIVIGVATIPFSVEKSRRLRAYKSLKEFRKHCDTVILLDNNKLLEYCPNLPLEQAFSVMDQIIAETIKGITETILHPSLINIDFADIRAIMRGGNVATLFVGESKSQQRAKDVVRNCLSHPFLDANIERVTGALVHISGGTDLTIKRVEEIIEELTFDIDENASVIWGARIYSKLEGLVRVTTTGLLKRPDKCVKEVFLTRYVE